MPWNTLDGDLIPKKFLTPFTIGSTKLALNQDPSPPMIRIFSLTPSINPWIRSRPDDRSLSAMLPRPLLIRSGIWLVQVIMDATLSAAIVRNAVQPSEARARSLAANWRRALKARPGMAKMKFMMATTLVLLVPVAAAQPSAN